MATSRRRGVPELPESVLGHVMGYCGWHQVCIAAWEVYSRERETRVLYPQLVCRTWRAARLALKMELEVPTPDTFWLEPERRVGWPSTTANEREDKDELLRKRCSRRSEHLLYYESGLALADVTVRGIMKHPTSASGKSRLDLGRMLTRPRLQHLRVSASEIVHDSADLAALVEAIASSGLETLTVSLKTLDRKSKPMLHSTATGKARPAHELMEACLEHAADRLRVALTEPPRIGFEKAMFLTRRSRSTASEVEEMFAKHKKAARLGAADFDRDVVELPNDLSLAVLHCPAVQAVIKGHGDCRVGLNFDHIFSDKTVAKLKQARCFDLGPPVVSVGFAATDAKTAGVVSSPRWTPNLEHLLVLWNLHVHPSKALPNLSLCRNLFALKVVGRVTFLPDVVPPTVERLAIEFDSPRTLVGRLRLGLVPSWIDFSGLTRLRHLSVVGHMANVRRLPPAADTVRLSRCKVDPDFTASVERPMQLLMLESLHVATDPGDGNRRDFRRILQTTRPRHLVIAQPYVSSGVFVVGHTLQDFALSLTGVETLRICARLDLAHGTFASPAYDPEAAVEYFRAAGGWTVEQRFFRCFTLDDAVRTGRTTYTEEYRHTLPSHCPNHLFDRNDSRVDCIIREREGEIASPATALSLLLTRTAHQDTPSS